MSSDPTLELRSPPPPRPLRSAAKPPESHRKTASVGPWFHYPGFILGLPTILPTAICFLGLKALAAFFALHSARGAEGGHLREHPEDAAGALPGLQPRLAGALRPGRLGRTRNSALGGSVATLPRKRHAGGLGRNPEGGEIHKSHLLRNPGFGV